MPVASCDKEYAPGGHAGSQPARAAERSGQRVARAAGRHGAERRAVLAGRRRHADGRRSGTGLRRPQVLYRAGRPHARGQRHRAALDQLGHGLRRAAQQAAPHGLVVRARLPLRLPAGRSGGPRADPHRRLRGRRALGRAAGLLRSRRRLPAAPPAGDDLSRGRPGSSGPSGPAPPELILRGGDVLLHDVEWRVERGDVVVRDGRIAAGGRLDPAHREERGYGSARLGAAELLLGGTTAILDMETVHHTGAAFEALDRSGIRATAGKCLMDAHPEGAPLGLAESTDAALAEAESLARRWHGAAGGRLRWCFAPRFVPSCSGPLLRAASDLAERHGAQLHTHAAETIVERGTVLRTTGLEEIAYLDSVGIAGPRAAVAHCVWVDQHEIARLAAQ